ncbi:chitin deacetylase [Ceratobasidium sp. AG-Ba]|nr:chitin deacetylase [Ceratobasidium sp. AG-Ba]
MYGLTAVLALLAAAPAALAHPLDHAHVEKRSLGARWYHDADHPAHPVSLRAKTNDSYPAVGSPAWSQKYPSGKLSTAGIPTGWIDVLNKAVSDGRIPSNCPVSTMAGGGAPSYKNGTKNMDPAKQPICSSSSQCQGDGQIYDVPDGIVAISFDDGPLPPAMKLQQFLRQNNQKVTHFYIGQNILDNPNIFLDAFNVSGDDIAVHTWTHPYMTTLSNELVVAELGWTMQIIHDSTGGRLPRFWRPPYGDSDNRVRAIAREVFGLTTVIWNADTNDWAITEGTQTVAGATKVLQKAYTGPKSPGLCILEHELSTQSVSVFINNYGLIAQNGWTPKTIADSVGQPWYLNAADDKSAVTPLDVAQPIPNGAATGGSGNSTASGTGSGTATGTAASSSSTAGSKSGALSFDLVQSAWFASAAVVPVAFALF